MPAAANTKPQPSFVAIVAAAGASSRLGEALPKPLLELGGRSILERSLDLIEACSLVKHTIVTAPSVLLSTFESMVASRKSVTVVAGGPTRQHSIGLALKHIDKDPELSQHSHVMVHDAARCLCTTELVERVAAAAIKFGAAIPGMPVVDTVKRCANEVVIDSIDRSGLWAVQTPQAFELQLLADAYRTNEYTATDDSSLVERFKEVRIVRGERLNLKITDRDDLDLARSLVSLRQGEGA